MEDVQKVAKPAKLTSLKTLRINPDNSYCFNFLDFLHYLEKNGVSFNQDFENRILAFGDREMVGIDGSMAGVFRLEDCREVNHSFIKDKFGDGYSFANKEIEECLLILFLFKHQGKNLGQKQSPLSHDKPNCFYGRDIRTGGEVLDVVSYNLGKSCWQIDSFPIEGVGRLPLGTHIVAIIKPELVESLIPQT